MGSNGTPPRQRETKRGAYVSPMAPRPSHGSQQSVKQPATSTDDGFATSVALGYAMNDGIAGGLLGGNIVGGMVGDAMNTSSSDDVGSSSDDSGGSCDSGFNGSDW